MIQPSFHIMNDPNVSKLDTPANLLVMYQPSQVLFLWFYQNIPQLEKLTIYDLPKGKESEPLMHLNQILEQELTDRQAIVCLLYNLPDATLLPASFYDMDLTQALMSVVSGDATGQLILSEKVTGEEIYNTFRVPSDVHKIFQEKLKTGVFWHIHSKWIGQVKHLEQPGVDTLHLNFSSEFFNLGYVKNGIPQLFQSYNYQTPEDVAFQLLTIVRELSLNPESLHLNIAGMVSTDSALLEELQKYFHVVSLESYNRTAWRVPALEEWPTHYFSNLLQLALCV